MCQSARFPACRSRRGTRRAPRWPRSC